MSALFFKNVIPQENQSIRVNDAVIRGHATIAEYATVGGSLTAGGAFSVGSSLTYANIDPANVIQLTNITTAIDATGVTNPYNFNVNTANAATLAGGEETFFLNMPAGVLNAFGFSSVSVYFYGGVVGTAGIPVLSIVTQESDRVTLVLRNVHATNALNGSLHFRFNHALGQSA
tara:strand:+ start:2578 stop:3099 length:522 start_codon:yes stop_codon:yes gene_type:complete